MATLDWSGWSGCPAVESIPGKRSSAGVFISTRVPFVTVFENLDPTSPSMRLWKSSA